MARNYEKNFGRLNRLWLENRTKGKVKRPPLSSLLTACEITKWLPDIKDEIDFCLKQSEVCCYTDQKVKEYHKRVAHLEVEYKAFIKKIKRLDSTVRVAPWTHRPYDKVKEELPVLPDLHPTKGNTSVDNFCFFPTPVLMHDQIYQQTTTGIEQCVNDQEGGTEYRTSDITLMDMPLDFRSPEREFKVSEGEHHP